MKHFAMTFGGFVGGVVLAKVVGYIVARRKAKQAAKVRPGSLEAYAEDAIKRAGY